MAFDFEFKFDGKDLNFAAMDPGKAQQIVDEVFESVMYAATEAVRDDVALETRIAVDPPVTGNLANSWLPTVYSDSNQIIGRVSSSQFYAPYFEFGTKPHFPPTEPLALWLQRKYGLTAEDAKRQSYAVALAISKRGTKGRYPMKKGWESSRERVKRMFDKALERIVQRFGSS